MKNVLLLLPRLRKDVFDHEEMERNGRRKTEAFISTVCEKIERKQCFGYVLLGGVFFFCGGAPGASCDIFDQGAMGEGRHKIWSSRLLFPDATENRENVASISPSIIEAFQLLARTPYEGGLYLSLSYSMVSGRIHLSDLSLPCRLTAHMKFGLI